MMALRDSTFGQHGRDSVLKIVARKSGLIICQSCNELGCAFEHLPFFLTDVEAGFAASGPKRAVEGDHIKFRCAASIYNYTRDSVKWYERTIHDKEDVEIEDNKLYKITKTSTKWSFGSELNFLNVSLADKGTYVCKAQPRMQRRRQQQQQQRRSHSYDVGGLIMSEQPEEVTLVERMLKLDVIPLEPPRNVKTNLGNGRDIIVDDPEDGLKLECQMTGRPQPQIKWTLNGRNVRDIANATNNLKILDSGQKLEIYYVLAGKYEGIYTCSAVNKVGRWSSSQRVILRSSLDKEQVYEYLSVPVIVAVVVALILVVILIVVAKCCCYRRRSWKAPPTPPTPPTPKLRQYEMPQDLDEEEDDFDCRMTLTSTTRDGSISPYNGGSILGTLDHRHCHCHYPCHPSSAVPTPFATLGRGPINNKCAICEDFSSGQTLPLNRMIPTLPARMGTPSVAGSSNYNGRSAAISPSSVSLSPSTTAPRSSAEF